MENFPISAVLSGQSTRTRTRTRTSLPASGQSWQETQAVGSHHLCLHTEPQTLDFAVSSTLTSHTYLQTSTQMAYSKKKRKSHFFFLTYPLQHHVCGSSWRCEAVQTSGAIGLTDDHHKDIKTEASALTCYTTMVAC